MLGGAILLNLMGWIPVVLGVVAVGWVVMKLMSRSASDEDGKGAGAA